MTVDIILNAAGGLALFLLAMVMMTDGLKAYIGRSLKTVLQKWTSSSLRGVASGALLTAVVQSSSAVTVATIGFVNAGVLTLKQAMGVIFGSNVGTTMTGWLVSLIGFGLKIEALAMPLLAVGVGVRLIARQKRSQALGDAITGFALFFLGLAVLKEAFSGVASAYGTGLLTSGNTESLALFILAGFVATVLTQSSSAAIAIILMAASEAVLGVNAAAAAIIGANIGTTSTAVLAAISATPNAKRVAAGHVVFNVSTGLVALVMLPGILAITGYAGDLIGVGADNNVVPFLALFHTAFNILGIVLLLPFTGWLAGSLSKLFKSEEEDISRPHFLDRSALGAPAMAVAALWNELDRMKDYACATFVAALREDARSTNAVRKKSAAVFSLGRAVLDFVSDLRMEEMPREVSDEVPRIIRTARYLEDASLLVPEVSGLVSGVHRLRGSPEKDALEALLECGAAAVVLISDKLRSEAHNEKITVAMEVFQTAYQAAKSALLQAAADHSLSTDEVDELLDRLSHTRRLIEQAAKADAYLNNRQILAENN